MPNYINNFKSHKIPGVAKNVCCCEQKIAYNFLFSWAWNSYETKSKILSLIQNDLIREKDGKFKKYDIDLIYHYVLQSYDRYITGHDHIFTSYEALAAVIYSDIYKAA